MELVRRIQLVAQVFVACQQLDSTHIFNLHSFFAISQISEFHEVRPLPVLLLVWFELDASLQETCVCIYKVSNFFRTSKNCSVTCGFSNLQSIVWILKEYIYVIDPSSPSSWWRRLVVDRSLQDSKLHILCGPFYSVKCRVFSGTFNIVCKAYSFLSANSVKVGSKLFAMVSPATLLLPAGLSMQAMWKIFIK